MHIETVLNPWKVAAGRGKEGRGGREFDRGFDEVNTSFMSLCACHSYLKNPVVPGEPGTTSAVKVSLKPSRF